MLERTNPLLEPWSAHALVPAFERIRPEHFESAFDQAMAEHLAALDAIARQPQAPSFDDTVAAFDRAGQALGRIERLYWNLCAACTSEALQAVERTMAPRLAAHDSRVYMHAGVFARVDAVHAQRAQLGLSDEDLRLLERVHLDFVRAGARMEAAQQARYAQVMQELAELTTQFAQNVLADETAFALALRNEADLAGLPPWLRAAAAAAAKERAADAAHVITLSRSLVSPFLAFSTRRDLREQAWRAWTSRGEHPGAHDNRPLVARIMQLRLEQARLHGYASYADYQLADTMAQRSDAVRSLLQRVWQPARALAQQELEALRAMAASLDDDTDVQPWDWLYLAEKVRVARFGLDDADVKPYFSLDAMLHAAFDCAERLFGLRFAERSDVAAYHPDVRVFEVFAQRDGASAALGVFLSDNYARPGKRSGAWMSAYRVQSHRPGEAAVAPVIANHNNFSKAPAGESTLLSFDDARTLFHEFGHGLHGLLSDVKWERLAGTSVLRDFVELPSQLFEHWLMQPQVLKRHARHHRTGEPIPDALIERIEAARRFNQGFETVQYAASALVDLALHERTDDAPLDPVAFEAGQLRALGCPPQVGMRHRLPHFSHLFAGSGYACAYYVYLWAEVLDADAFCAFTDAGDPFDAGVAQRLRRFIYASGNTIEPGAAYRAFRGRDAQPEPMMRKRGLLPQT
jgi:peptidyl-dipeptidase Dcp